ncbi:protein-tyrosine phosphatase family protein [uncultured Lentibacter sp.]|uniref:phosphatase domain-containing putative toxin n=1 Tax=uncultured Lentibacter sp. TaxID=1659309 RepID=UPI00261EB936|nr:protein-tyrosine phosphatase family protein [uncultured Lentibacter sp.]MCW1954960.1 protein-tyrosine phosphatase family protein [Roseobacter sp.]
MVELEIAALSVGEGTLAIASLPGRGGDLKGDLALFGEFKPSLVLTMVTAAELEGVGAGQFGFEVQALGSRWAHLPVADYGIPTLDALARWAGVSQMARAALNGGGRVIVHCKGGCGRSGMAALRLMIEAGEAPEAALKRLRAVRPCAVETAEQLAWAMAQPAAR